MRPPVTACDCGSSPSRLGPGLATGTAAPAVTMPPAESAVRSSPQRKGRSLQSRLPGRSAHPFSNPPKDIVQGKYLHTVGDANQAEPRRCEQGPFDMVQRAARHCPKCVDISFLIARQDNERRLVLLVL